MSTFLVQDVTSVHTGVNQQQSRFRWTISLAAQATRLVDSGVNTFYMQLDSVLSYRLVFQNLDSGKWKAELVDK